MRFGLFSELQLAKEYGSEQWSAEAEQQLVKEALEQVEFAGQIGFDYIFEVEHHFLGSTPTPQRPRCFLQRPASA